MLEPWPSMYEAFSSTLSTARCSGKSIMNQTSKMTLVCPVLSLQSAQKLNYEFEGHRGQFLRIVNLENTVSKDSGKSVGKVSLRCACRT